MDTPKWPKESVHLPKLTKVIVVMVIWGKVHSPDETREGDQIRNASERVKAQEKGCKGACKRRGNWEIS